MINEPQVHHVEIKGLELTPFDFELLKKLATFISFVRN
jgi:hypothetical protein